jgi:hypothetical protein
MANITENQFGQASLDWLDAMGTRIGFGADIGPDNPGVATG